jgi:eukaryotic-like serine/threonine-protein kinase
VGPFRGLDHFDVRDRAVYFGRSAEVAAALETLRSRGLLALVGPSGSGKSSLARAGVLPAVVDGGLGGWPKRWDVATATPGSDPRAAIAQALVPFVERARDRSPDELVDALAGRAQETGFGVLLLVDQLEELATSAAGASRAWTAQLLARIGERPLPGVRAVVTARRDLLDPLLALPDFGRVLVRGSVLIEPMPDAAWADVIEQALAAYGYAFEDEEVVAQVQGELRGAAMPLVQFALAELWRSRDTAKKRITRASVRALGGIAAALERHAEATLSSLAAKDAGAIETVRQVFLTLTTPQGTRITKPLVTVLEAGGPGAAPVVEAFERARLLVRAQDGIRIAHEALLVQWGRLRSWVAEGREDRLLAETLEHDARRWKEDRDATPLWRRRKLAHAVELSRRGSVALSDPARAFVEAAGRAERRGRVAAGAVAAVVLLSTAVAVGSWVRSVRGEEAAARRELALEAASRAEADQRSREIQAKQERIDELLASIASSPKQDEVRDEVRALQAEILAARVPGAAPRPAARPERAAAFPPAEAHPPPGAASIAAPAATASARRKPTIHTDPPF